MANKKSLFSWKEAFRLNLRALKLLWKRYPYLVLCQIPRAIWEQLTPYVGIYLSAQIIGEIAGNRDPQRLIRLVGISLVSALVIGIISSLFNRWRERQISYGTAHFRLSFLFSEKMLDMDFADVDKTQTHTLLNRIQDTQQSGSFGFWHVVTGLETLIASLANIGGGIALTVSLFTSPVPESAGSYTILNHPAFLVGLIGIMLGTTLLSPVLLTKSRSYLAKNLDAESLSNRKFSFFGWLGNKRECYGDMRIYRQIGICEKYIRDKTSMFHSKGFFAKLSLGPVGLYRAASSAVSVVFTGVAYLFVCLKAWAGAFGVGQVTQYIGAITRVSEGVTSLITELGEMRNNATFLQMFFEFLDIPNNMYQGSLTVEKRSDREYEVEFKNVSFRYPGSEIYALKNISMKFKIGSRLAVVGMNGSGKTTFIKLLCRLYDPTEGEILLNGIDIRKYDYRNYLSIFSVVFQDFKLFGFGLGENVACGGEYDAEKVTDCLIKAGLQERLARMPKGLDTCLYKDFDAEGTDVSGGEAQKIALARTLYKDAPFIILDEPTAALDPVAEAEVYSKFNEIVEDKTAIYISHRLSSCRFCDEIAVFDHGQVVQQGSHEALLSDADGMYHKLWHAQAQYYTED